MNDWTVQDELHQLVQQCVVVADGRAVHVETAEQRAAEAARHRHR
jgi:hypothetical protein